MEHSLESPDRDDKKNQYRLALQKRKQTDDLKRKEEDFLRQSLRQSERLRALERARRVATRPAVATTGVTGPEGRENQAFEGDGGFSGLEDADDMKPILPAKEVHSFLEDLHQSLNDIEGDDCVEPSDWLRLDDFVKSESFTRAYTLQERVSRVLAAHWSTRPLPLGVGESGVVSSLTEVLSVLTGSAEAPATSNRVRELSLLLNQTEIKSLLEAHDSIAGSYHGSGGLAPHYPNHPAVGELNGGIDLAGDGGSDVIGSPVTPRKPRKARISKKGGKKTADDKIKLTGNGVVPASPQLSTGPYDDETTLVGRRKVPADGIVSPSAEETVIHSSLPGCYATVSNVDGQVLKTVVLQKGEEPLGATVRNEGSSVLIGRLVVGGIAQQSGLLKEGDELLNVNQIDMFGKDVNTVSDILARLKSEPVEFVINPIDANYDFAEEERENLSQLRALFTYHPEDDLYIPCREIGLSFEKGDILHVINTRDPNWWQGYRDGEDMSGRTLAGLLPSPEFQRHRELLRRQHQLSEEALEARGEGGEDGGGLCLGRCKKSKQRTSSGGGGGDLEAGVLRRAGNKKRKNKYSPSEIEFIEAEEIHTYEMVAQYLPQPHRKRPLVLVGPPQIGRHELLLRIIEEDTNKFAKVVTHTTRSREEEDSDMGANEYTYITKSEFEQMMDDNQFVEYGIFEKHKYGTSRQGIADVIVTGKTCVISLQPESLKALRETSFIPFVIFIAPPSTIDFLRTLRTKLAKGVRPSDEELLHTIERGRKMEERYGHWFDRIIVNNDLDRSFNQIMEEIDRLEQEAQWVPQAWLTSADRSTSSYYYEREVDIG